LDLLFISIFQKQKLSILPRSGGALGFTYTPPTTEDRYLLFVDELRGRLVTLLGGRAAEEIVLGGRVSTGALDDIRRATDMAYKAVAEYGLNQRIGPISLATLSNGGLDDSGGSPFGRDQVCLKTILISASQRSMIPFAYTEILKTDYRAIWLILSSGK
jgi:ATP-dependent Zn protease